MGGVAVARRGEHARVLAERRADAETNHRRIEAAMRGARQDLLRLALSLYHCRAERYWAYHRAPSGRPWASFREYAEGHHRLRHQTALEYARFGGIAARLSASSQERLGGLGHSAGLLVGEVLRISERAGLDLEAEAGRWIALAETTSPVEVVAQLKRERGTVGGSRVGRTAVFHVPAAVAGEWPALVAALKARAGTGSLGAAIVWAVREALAAEPVVPDGARPVTVTLEELQAQGCSPAAIFAIAAGKMAVRLPGRDGAWTGAGPAAAIDIDGVLEDELELWPVAGAP